MGWDPSNPIVPIGATDALHLHLQRNDLSILRDQSPNNTPSTPKRSTPKRTLTQSPHESQGTCPPPAVYILAPHLFILVLAYSLQHPDPTPIPFHCP